jgi:ATP adenylyltransferase
MILWDKIRTTQERALKSGSLQPIATTYQIVEQDGIDFLVRILTNLKRKETATQQQSKDFNPFLPYDQELFITNIGEHHVCLLNKFNVVDDHLLIVTREFEEQESWLTSQDFVALQSILLAIDGLAFYNGGKIAGASQRHKHLQLVPLPLIPEGTKVPIATAISAAIFAGDIGHLPCFPFLHGLIKIELPTDPQNLLASYLTLLKYLHILPQDARAYNLLVTREWMLVVPRSQESYQSISINSLGFAGALLVKNEIELNFVKKYGPVNILKKVAQFQP